MGASNGRKSAALEQQLFDQPARFDFFQAVRLLELLSVQQPSSNADERRATVGYDLPPSAEPVRFTAHASQAFPPAPIVDLLPATKGTVDHSDGSVEGPLPPRMTVAFMGLTGPQGVLPDHYTRMMIDRIRDNDRVMQKFFDLFNHRVVSLAYRAWAKHRLFIEYEASRTSGSTEPDPITHALHCFTGMGTAELRGRLEYGDEVHLFFGGHRAMPRPIAISLELMLREYFNLRLVLEQFLGRWLSLSSDEHSRIGTPLGAKRSFSQLGKSAWLGSRVWDVQSKFRIRIGPLDYATFLEFLPTGRSFVVLCQFIRTYVGPEFDFDVQLVLLKREVPRTQLGVGGPKASRLGWNSWLYTRRMKNNADDAVFSGDGMPIAKSSTNPVNT